MRTRAAAALLTSALMACSSASGPGGGEPLVVSNATVQSALDFSSTQMTIPPSCGGSPVVNCPGGNPGMPIALAITRTALDITRRTGPDSLTFDWAADVKIVSPGIPVTVPTVGACTLTVDTRPGTDSTVHVSGTATFSRQRPDGPIDRISVAGEDVSGLSDDDISFGGSFGCSLVDFGAAFFTATLSASLFPELRLCSAPGAPLFVICPPNQVVPVYGVVSHSDPSAEAAARPLHESLRTPAVAEPAL